MSDDLKRPAQPDRVRFGAGLLAMVARTAYHAAGGRLEEAPATPTTELDTPYELERAASLRARLQRLAG